MKAKVHFAGMALATAMLVVWAGSCSSSSEQPPLTSHMQSAVGTPDEISPTAPAAARNVRKVGNQWRCDMNGQAMVYNSVSGKWEPQP